VIRAIHIVYAKWCPHCVPVAVEPLQNLAKKLGIPCILYDIDTGDVKKADELVKKYGDWTADYLIPQVFVEGGDGEMRHVLTGRPEGLLHTRIVVENLVKSEIFARK
jgi:thiol-disulfide isomerase/thioredoxin